jgi:hypothetical protein
MFDTYETKRSTVRSESRSALKLRYVDLVQACTDARKHDFQTHFVIHSDFPNALYNTHCVLYGYKSKQRLFDYFPDIRFSGMFCIVDWQLGAQFRYVPIYVAE